MRGKIRAEQLNYLQRIKPIFSPPLVPEKQPVGVQVSASGQQVTDMSGRQGSSTEVSAPAIDSYRFDELMKRIESLETMLENQPSADDDTVRKNKMKEEIMSALQQHRKLTSSQLSNLVGLSRTRCNEYFRQLTKEGRTEGVIINRQKYYKLTGK